MSEELNEDNIRTLGYDCPRKLPTGEWAALYDYLFTGALVVGLDCAGYRMRYCYATKQEAEKALEEWDGTGDPSGPWIKAKGGEDGDRLGPGIISGEE